MDIADHGLTVFRLPRSSLAKLGLMNETSLAVKHLYQQRAAWTDTLLTYPYDGGYQQFQQCSKRGQGRIRNLYDAVVGLDCPYHSWVRLGRESLAVLYFPILSTYVSTSLLTVNMAISAMARCTTLSPP